MLLMASILFASVPPAKAQFTLAGWDYPDTYGQGIESIEVFENSTGSWVQVGGAYQYSDSQGDLTLDWTDRKSVV